MEWITKNWVALTAIILAVIRFAESIAELTPTEKDDKLVAKVKSILKNFITFDNGNN